MKRIEKEFNIQTNKETITERDETVAERLIREKLETEAAQRKTEARAKVEARQALLNKLGITEEEARLLLGGN